MSRYPRYFRSMLGFGKGIFMIRMDAPNQGVCIGERLVESPIGHAEPETFAEQCVAEGTWNEIPQRAAESMLKMHRN